MAVPSKPSTISRVCRPISGLGRWFDAGVAESLNGAFCTLWSPSAGCSIGDHRQFFNCRSRGVTVTYAFRSTQALREEIVINQTAALRRLLADEAFIHLPVAYDALGGRLIESTGFKSAYVGGLSLTDRKVTISHR